MARCRNTIFGLLTALLFVSSGINAAQYSSNMFLNGEYQNGVKSQGAPFSVNPASNIFLEHAIISRQASPFQGPTYLPPKEFLKCASGQQCVRKNQCQSGYFTQQLAKIQNCEPDTDICCTYRAPPTTTTTTPTPFATCGRDSDCVPAADCRNGEIIAIDYIRKQTTSRCYAPQICCRMPSTTLTNEGYIFNLPETKFPLPTNPTVSAQRPTQPPYRPAPTQATARPTYNPPQPTQPAYRPQPTQKPSNEYLPPKPTQPAYRPQPTQPQPTQPSYRPQPTQPTYRPQPTQAPRPQPTQPPRPQPTQPAYRPQPTQPAYRPQPTQSKEYLPPKPQPQPQPRPTTAPRQPQPQPQPTYRPTQRPQTTPNNQYLPPDSENEIPSRRPTQRPYVPDRIPAPSNINPMRGEAQLSPQIVPPFNGGNIPKHFAKCASALVCTAENYCNAIGVITDAPVELSPMEAAFRVPLTDCLIEGSGADGKCCRDSNYVDPWPVNLAGVCAARNKGTKPVGIKDIDANFAEIPWQTMILKESTKTLLCGGAIIGDEFVLTSASCVKGLSVQDARIKAGEWELGKTTEPLPFQLVGAKSIDTHPEYNPSTGANDMAIIRLEKRLEFATHIQPICISDEDPKPSENCVTTGWGKQALQIHQEGAVMHVTSTSTQARSDCGADGTSVCSATKFDACEFDVGSALACGSGSNVRLKGVYAAENGCGDGQTVRFSKPDVKWINTAFAAKNKPLLLKRF